MSTSPFSLQGKTGIVTGLANADSIAYGCARALHQAGAELLLTYGNAKADQYVQPLAAELGDSEALLCDVRDDAQVAALFERAATRWGKIDFLIHSMAFALKDDLHGRVVDCSREGFALAMDISCHSFIRLARHAEPLLKDGGTPVHERRILPEELEGFQECFLTGTAAEVTPVGQIGDWHFQVGGMTRKVAEDYERLVRA